ncbi:MAG TPA: hypothetical protein VJR67_03890 [Candidatus Nitrosopolaris sp.]|nr:hypothetical protein [Candidatus Nitrosopolaris sp.]
MVFERAIFILKESRSRGLIAILLLAICVLSGGYGNIERAFADGPVKVITQPAFTGSDNKVKVIGIVKNLGTTPVEVTLGLNVVQGTTNSSTTIREPTYGRIIYPSSVSPFKFSVEPSWSIRLPPYLLSSREALVPHYKVLSLSYSNAPVGTGRALVGTVKNISPFNLQNVTILASVHTANGTQIDSVKSNMISVIKPGQSSPFTAIPDPIIKGRIAYFSCADIDVGNNASLNTLPLGNGRFIAYQMSGLAEISDFRYDNLTNSLVFGIKHFNPAGGLFSLKIPQMSKGHVTVMFDGKLFPNSSVKTDGRTISIDIFVPPSNHQVQIKGIV